MLSDSNQLVCAVESLDCLVFDAVVGVRIDETVASDGGTLSAMMSCSECQAKIGRVYSLVTPELTAVLSQPSAPRYAMQRRALASYVFGSAKAQHDAVLSLETSEKAVDVGDDSFTPEHGPSIACSSAVASSDSVALVRCQSSKGGNGLMMAAAPASGATFIPDDIQALIAAMRAEMRDELRTLAERLSMVEAAGRSVGGLGVAEKVPFKDEGARERLNQLTRALLSLDGRLEVVEDARAETRDSVWSELQGSKEPSPDKYAADRKRARVMAASQYV